MPGKRVTKAVSIMRTQEVYSLLTSAHSRKQIQQIMADKHGLSERQIDEYIKKAREDLEHDCDLARPQYLAELLSRLRNYEQAAAKRGQMQVAVNAATQQAKLIGLDGAS